MATTPITILSPDQPTWSSVPNGNQGAAWSLPPFRACAFQVTGTFGAGGSIRLEGSNDNTNWAPLSPAALTSAGFFASLGVLEYPRYIRPKVTAGDGTTSLTVIGNTLTKR